MERNHRWLLHGYALQSLKALSQILCLNTIFLLPLHHTKSNLSDRRLTRHTRRRSSRPKRCNRLRNPPSSNRRRWHRLPAHDGREYKTRHCSSSSFPGTISIIITLKFIDANCRSPGPYRRCCCISSFSSQIFVMFLRYDIIP